MDPVKREAMLKQIMQMWHDDAVTMPILYGNDIFAATPRLKNFQNWNRVLLWERMTLEGNG
jgi:CTP:molybdopterin cytidylyltransferase MocA